MTVRLGVCSWSLRPEGPDDLVEKTAAVGVSFVQLALDPLRTGAWPAGATARALAWAGIGIASGMMAMEGEDYTSLDSIRRTGGVVPDATWPANLAAARANAALARELGLRLVTFHAGFIPHRRDAPERAKLLARLRALADVYAAEGVHVAFETGQEPAPTLLDALDALDRPAAGVNFDPANLILYGAGDPVAALRSLASRVRQVHIKDAIPSPVAGAWGSEVRVGTGTVRWHELFAALRAAGITCDLMLEREAGPDRVGDLRAARALVLEHVGSVR